MLNGITNMVLTMWFILIVGAITTGLLALVPKRYWDRYLSRFQPYEKDGDPIATCKRCEHYTLMSKKNPSICTWCQAYEELQNEREDEQRRKHLERVRQERQAQKRAFYEAVELTNKMAEYAKKRKRQR